MFVNIAVSMAGWVAVIVEMARTGPADNGWSIGKLLRDLQLTPVLLRVNRPVLMYILPPKVVSAVALNVVASWLYTSTHIRRLWQVRKVTGNDFRKSVVWGPHGGEYLETIQNVALWGTVQFRERSHSGTKSGECGGYSSNSILATRTNVSTEFTCGKTSLHVAISICPIKDFAFSMNLLP
jgi:hypothetical protein